MYGFELTHAGSVSVGNLLLLALVVEDKLLVLADAESSKVLLLVVSALGTLLALGEEKREATLRGADAGEVERAARAESDETKGLGLGLGGGDSKAAEERSSEESLELHDGG